LTSDGVPPNLTGIRRYDVSKGFESALGVKLEQLINH
jgi:hypothetical protein